MHQLAATRGGIRGWWTGQLVAGDEGAGGQLSVYLRAPANPAATFDVLERGPQQIVWRCLDGPNDKIDTRTALALKPRANGGTTLFSHEGWDRKTSS